MTEIVVRPTAPEELRAASNVMRVALLEGPFTDDEWPQYEPSWLDMDSVSAWDGERCVGHAGAYRLGLVVPGGGHLATAGVTRVGVAPTHTRRGLLTRMIVRLLQNERTAGRPLAALRATEAVIYERYGFGVANEAEVVEIDARLARPVAGAGPGELRLLERAEALDVISSLYTQLASTRVGAITRPTWMWTRYLAELLGAKEAQHVVVHQSPDGELDGFAHFQVTRVEERHDHEWGRADVFDLWGADPGVERALWRFLTELDLVRLIRVEECPRDTIVRGAAADRRAVTTRLRYDETWLRLLDVGAALAARTYSEGPDVVIEVTDPLFPDNQGRWRIGEGVASRTSDLADIATTIVGLSAAYLGSTSWWELAATGRASADPDAVRLADARFGVRPLAFSGSYF